MKLKKMIIFSILLTAVGLIIAAVGVSFYRYYSGLQTEESFEGASKERKKIKENMNNEFEKTLIEMQIHKDSLQKKVEDEAGEIISELREKSSDAKEALDLLKKQSNKATREISHELSKISDSIIENNSIENALNYKIKNLAILLHLSEKIKPDKYISEGFTFTMSNSGNKVQLTYGAYIKSLFIINPNKIKNKTGIVWGTHGETFAFYRNKEGDKTRYSYGSSDNELKTIPLSVSLRHDLNKPIRNIRDLDEWFINFYLPKEIAEITSKIELVANASLDYKKYVKLFEIQTNDNSWENINNNFDKGFSAKLNSSLKYVKNVNTPENLWQIKISKASIESSENTIISQIEHF